VALGGLLTGDLSKQSSLQCQRCIMSGFGNLMMMMMSGFVCHAISYGEPCKCLVPHALRHLQVAGYCEWVTMQLSNATPC
jgi:hypothetical protein